MTNEVPAPQWQLLDSNQTPRRRKGCLRFMFELCGGCFLLLFGCSAVSSFIGLAAWVRYNDSTVSAEQNASYTIPADEVITLKLDTRIAQIRVRPAETNASEVRIEIDKYVRSVSRDRANSALDDFDVRIRNEIEDTQTVSVVTSDNVFAFSGLVPVVREIEITLVVPRDVAVNIQTGLGQVRIEEGVYNQPFLIQTNDGQITVANVEFNSDLTLRTENGVIEIKESTARGVVSVRTQFGAITMNDFETPSGVTASTGTGTIEFNGTIPRDNPDAIYDLKVTSGDLTFKVSESSVFYLEASVEFGDLENKLDLAGNPPSEDDPIEIAGGYNTDETSGIPRVILHTQNGSVTIDSE